MKLFRAVKSARKHAWVRVCVRVHTYLARTLNVEKPKGLLDFFLRVQLRVSRFHCKTETDRRARSTRTVRRDASSVKAPGVPVRAVCSRAEEANKNITPCEATPTATCEVVRACVRACYTNIHCTTEICCELTDESERREVHLAVRVGVGPVHNEGNLRTTHWKS